MFQLLKGTVTASGSSEILPSNCDKSVRNTLTKIYKQPESQNSLKYARKSQQVEKYSLFLNIFFYFDFSMLNRQIFFSLISKFSEEQLCSWSLSMEML